MAPAMASVCGDRSVCFQLLALFTLGFWTPLLRARVSGKRLPRCFGVNPRLLLEEFPFSCGDFARAVRLEIWTLGCSFCTILDSTVDTSSSIALGCFWTNFQYCLREGELGSCGRFTSCSSQFGEVCTVVASIAWTA